MSESNDSTRRTSSGLIALIPKNQVASPTGQHVQRPRFLPVERDPFKFYLQNRLEPSRILRNSSGEHFRTFQSSPGRQNHPNLSEIFLWKLVQPTPEPDLKLFQFPNTSGTFKLYPGTVQNPQKLLQHCTAITKNKDGFCCNLLKKNANLAAVAWSMTSMSTLNPFPMAGTEDCQLMGGTIDCCPLH